MWKKQRRRGISHTILYIFKALLYGPCMKWQYLVTFLLIVQTQALILEPGYHLISLPLVQEISSAQFLQKHEGKIERIWSLDAKKSKQDRVHWLSYPSLQEDKTLSLLKPGKGYWLLVKEQVEFFQLPNDSVSPINLPDRFSHFLFGMPYHANISTPEQILQDQLGNIEVLWGWDFLARDWLFWTQNSEVEEHLRSSGFETLQYLEPGRAYIFQAKVRTPKTPFLRGPRGPKGEPGKITRDDPVLLEMIENANGNVNLMRLIPQNSPPFECSAQTEGSMFYHQGGFLCTCKAHYLEFEFTRRSCLEPSTKHTALGPEHIKFREMPRIVNGKLSFELEPSEQVVEWKVDYSKSENMDPLEGSKTQHSWRFALPIESASTLFFRVALRNRAGSYLSKIFRFDRKPDPITNIRLSRVGEDYLEVVWDDINNSSYDCVISHQGEKVSGLSTDSPFCHFNKLAPNQVYDLSVRAKYNELPGQWIQSSFSTQSYTGKSVDDFQAFLKPDGSVKLSWQASPGAEAYIVNIRSSDEEVYQSLTFSNPEPVLINIPSSKIYEFEIFAQSSNGTTVTTHIRDFVVYEYLPLKNARVANYYFNESKYFINRDEATSNSLLRETATGKEILNLGSYGGSNNLYFQLDNDQILETKNDQLSLLTQNGKVIKTRTLSDRISWIKGVKNGQLLVAALGHGMELHLLDPETLEDVGELQSFSNEPEISRSYPYYVGEGPNGFTICYGDFHDRAVLVKFSYEGIRLTQRIINRNKGFHALNNLYQFSENSPKFQRTQANGKVTTGTLKIPNFDYWTTQSFINESRYSDINRVSDSDVIVLYTEFPEPRTEFRKSILLDQNLNFLRHLPQVVLKIFHDSSMLTLRRVRNQVNPRESKTYLEYYQHYMDNKPTWSANLANSYPLEIDSHDVLSRGHEFVVGKTRNSRKILIINRDKGLLLDKFPGQSIN